jgi:hypothetical protein
VADDVVAGAAVPGGWIDLLQEGGKPASAVPGVNVVEFGGMAQRDTVP